MENVDFEEPVFKNSVCPPEKVGPDSTDSVVFHELVDSRLLAIAPSWRKKQKNTVKKLVDTFPLPEINE